MSSNPQLPPTGDEVEAEHAELTLDNIIPTRGYTMAPLVGLGASAGGIAPLLEFFRTMPADSGLVFVVVMHLSPTHDSTLSSLLGRATSMPVHEAEDGQTVRPNNVYVIPPGKFLSSVDGKLGLDPMPVPRGKRNTIDLFFRTLADTHGPHAIAIVFSGAESDGALGIKRIKERGGLTIVQDPNEAEQPSMPRSAIATNMADWVLRTAEMPRRIVDYLESESRLKLPSEDAPPHASVEAVQDNEAALRDALLFVRTRTGRDLTSYKRATILRRIARRMQVSGLDNLPAYVAFMRTHPEEASALLQDLLISVTNFFRDREAFDALAQIIPSLFHGKDASASVRVWVPACATGEEAYSIAILLFEYAQSIHAPPSIQVFACDLNDEAIQAARIGHYPDTITTDVNEERLRRFFVHEQNGYRVRREVREMVLFATHDMLKDAPFSRMDLISCRNLLIYLGRDAQQRLLDIFHFALRPGGKLFLGSSESIDENSRLFHALDKKHRIFVQQSSTRATVTLPLGPTTLFRTMQAQGQFQISPVVHGKMFHTIPALDELGHDLDRAQLAELHFKLVERYSPPSLLVNGDHDIVHISERAGRYLRLAPGEPTFKLLQTVDPALRGSLQATLFRAVEAKKTVETAPIEIEIEGRKENIAVRVTPTPEIGVGHLLVVFQPRAEKSATTETVEADAAPPDAVVRYLERELEQMKLKRRDTVEQYEASTEELKASNEELQAMNEELRSATEELETSREELQSINEELTTVNQEMKAKMDELATANSDLQNLMASTAIATVFLDRDLTIMRYTPTAVAIFNLIPGDIGRPLAHLKHRLDYADLIRDAEQVHETLVPVEREVTDGTRWFLVRLQPYRTLDDHIGGVVLTLIDVTEQNRAADLLRLSEERLHLIIESAKDYAIFTMDPNRRIDSWSAGGEAVFGYMESEILGKPVDVLFSAEDRAAFAPEKEVERVRREGRATSERWYARRDGATFYGSGSMMPLRNAAREIKGFVSIMRDLTAGKRTDEALRDHVEELTRFNDAAVGRETRMIDLKKEINELAARLGEPPRYQVSEGSAT